MDTIALGTGILRWSRHERIADRYGTVNLDHAPDGADFDPTRFDTAPIGTRGRLIAVILCTRPLPALWGLGARVSPPPPAVRRLGGQPVVGAAVVGCEADLGAAVVGVGDCHSQTVRLANYAPTGSDNAAECARCRG